LSESLQIPGFLKLPDLRETLWTQGGETVLTAATRNGNTDEGTTDQMAKGKTKSANCNDCYFGANGLCALNLGKPCPTFRPAERGLRPERQLAFAFRTERIHAAYAFPQPR
jgi:hypothetical protein